MCCIAFQDTRIWRSSSFKYIVTAESFTGCYVALTSDCLIYEEIVLQLLTVVFIDIIQNVKAHIYLNCCCKLQAQICILTAVLFLHIILHAMCCCTISLCASQMYFMVLFLLKFSVDTPRHT